MTSMGVLAATLVLAGPLDRVRHLYDRARYDRALEVLQQVCPEAGEVRCEKLRAFVEAGRGAPHLAKAAFFRMLQINPGAQMEDGASPRLRQLYDEALRVKQWTDAAPVTVTAAGPDRWRVRVEYPAGISAQRVIAHVAPGDRQKYRAIELSDDGRSWWAEVSPPPGVQRARAYAVATVFDIEARLGPEEPPLQAVPTEPAGPVPTWGKWLIAGGVVAVVVIGLAVGSAAASGDATGALQIDLSPDGSLE